MATYRTFVPYDNSVAANIAKWGQAFGQAMLNFGWSAQSGHGEVVASAVSSVWTWTNTPSTPTAGTTGPRSVLNFRGAWSSGNGYAANDTVTNGGLTWIALTTVASGGSAPSSGASWQPYNFEVFLSTGPMSSALPIYVKFVYTNTNASLPALYVSVGTGVDSSGNLTGAVNLMTSAPLNVGQWNTGGSLNTSSIFEMDFSGDADNFRMCPWRNLIAQGVGSVSNAGPSVLVIDRAKTATGLDADGYVYVGWLGMSGASLAVAISAIILKGSIGSIVAQTTSPSWSGTLVTPSGASLSNWGSSPPMPIMPLVGYTANPLLGAITVQAQDSQNGSVIPVWLYGAPHYFLVCGSDTTLINYRQVNGISNSVVPAIRWE